MKFKIKLKCNRNRILQFAALLLCVIILFLITYKNIRINRINRINNVSEVNLINYEKATPKELFLECWQTIKTNYYSRDLNHQNWYRWKKRYIHQIKDKEDAAIAINSMIASLDDTYSKFMSEKEFQEQNSAINSKLYGIGINIASISGKIYIVNVLENAPAYNAGIRPGDIILKVNDINVNGQSVYQVAQLIRGDINVSLNLEILRGVEKLNINVKRDEIKVKTVTYKKLDNDIAYIRITSFIGLDTSSDFIVALNRLKNCKGLILDLRGNSGGLFQNAILISNLFLKKGTIVQVIARQGKKNIYSAQGDGCIYNKPVIILIDNHSASASEILSSALHDNNRAILVGDTTYGKGLVQKVFSLSNKTGMNLTIARYLTPKGEDINKKGIEPDYIVNIDHKDFIAGTDSQLNFAQNLMEKITKE